MERVTLTKKTRFEVFKRDKFQCQYCGKSAPDVVLNVDHIDPVSKGGTNDIINLITSCFDCNQGKKARLLSDDTIVQKQRKQLVLLEERREQLTLMFEWKKSLNEFDSEKVQMLTDYFNTFIQPHSLNEIAFKSLEKLTRKFTIEDIIEAIDIAINKYIQENDEGEITSESVQNAFNKIGGICVLKNRGEVEIKLAYIRGIGENRFNYFDKRRASILLNNYVKALMNKGWSEGEIIKDLEEELIPKTIECKNWTQWKQLLEGWINSVEQWENKDTSRVNEEKSSPSLDEIKEIADLIINNIDGRIFLLMYFGKLFKDFDGIKLKNTLLKECKQLLEGDWNFDEEGGFEIFLDSCLSISLYDFNKNNINKISLYDVLKHEILDNIDKVFRSITHFPENFNEKDIHVIKGLLIEKIDYLLKL
ncbi:HNH endonuclease [Flammeovirga sp. SJP92]|uniref:HNH endonuclease n=1 Tax=Flammeovirga sp. SJP92 TaxID=1775430 RepID=UPI0007C852C1|nr:HNH endonuclease [Flammeovirga sp. SJP92]